MAIKGGAKPTLKVGDVVGLRYKVVDLIGTGGTEGGCGNNNKSW